MTKVVAPSDILKKFSLINNPESTAVTPQKIDRPNIQLRKPLSDLGQRLLLVKQRIHSDADLSEELLLQLNQSLFDFLTSNQPTSLAEFYKMHESDEIEIQKLMAKYGDWIFSEIRHAQVMDNIINQLTQEPVKKVAEDDEQMGEIEIGEDELMEVLDISSEECEKIEGLIE